MARKRRFVSVLIAIVISTLGCGKPNKDLSEITKSWIGADISTASRGGGRPNRSSTSRTATRSIPGRPRVPLTEPPTHIPNTFGGADHSPR